MGLFDRFGKKKGAGERAAEAAEMGAIAADCICEAKETAVKTFEARPFVVNSEAPGWDSISSAFRLLYPDQPDPLHFAPDVPWALGGNDPLDGISVYDGGDYWHFVTYGLSELYGKESENVDVSGFGMEFTLKLAKAGRDDIEREFMSMCGVLQSLARLTCAKGVVFMPWQTIYTGQSNGIDAAGTSPITGFITVPETKIAEMETPNGTVVFTELVGATDAELLAIRGQENGVTQLYTELGTDVTNYDRASLR